MTARGLVVLLCGAALYGCAAEPVGTALPIASVANPPTGNAFRLTVVDKRRFAPRFAKVAKPAFDPRSDGDIRPRLFGRGGADKPPLVLAADTSVMQVAYAALANALRASGYRVVATGDPDYAAAPPLTADIDTFWAWEVTVPPASVELYYYECDIDLRLGGGWPLVDVEERRVRGNEWMFRPEASGAHWRAILTECVGEIDYVLKHALKKPGAS